MLVRPAPATLRSHGRPIEWQRGPLGVSELDKQEAVIRDVRENPDARNLYVLDAASGKEATIVPQWITDTMTVATDAAVR